MKYQLVLAMTHPVIATFNKAPKVQMAMFFKLTCHMLENKSSRHQITVARSIEPVICANNILYLY
jgi:hypothetical protein